MVTDSMIVVYPEGSVDLLQDPVEARKSVERAASLTRLLLGDLRAVVADMRRNGLKV